MDLQRAAFSSSSTNPDRCVYDVFLSFRGNDTRNNFTAHLLNALRLRGIDTYVDNELRRGVDISSALSKAIEDSRISIIILSKNYTSSTWCLNELIKILECKETKQQMVLPIFYHIDPSQVRNQKGSFRKAFIKHENRFKDDMEKVNKWKAGLKQVANLSGFHLKKERDESKFINEIIQWVNSRVINLLHLHVAKYQVGIESCIQEIDLLLNVGMNDIRMIGIFGIGGIGKTTIAKAIYNLIAYQFEGSCFLPNVKETSTRECGLVKLQETLLSKILGDPSLTVDNDDQGISMIKKMLCYKKVLLILDDVDQLEQLEKLAGRHDWFGSGSRIIITTRDQSLLSNHGVASTYKVKILDHDKALQLFSWHAFKRNKPIDDYAKLTEHVIRYAGGIPLVLTVLGSDLKDKSIYQWKSALDKYKRFPSKRIQEKLRISYDGLDDNEKAIFLDIACFFKGKHMDDVIKILDSRGYFSDIGIKILIDKCLITIDWHNILEMHDLLQDMGREIVRQESPEEPGKRSRLWFHEDVRYVLEEDTATNKIEAILVDLPKQDPIRLSSEVFTKMKRLKLFINQNGCFSGGPNYLPNELRVLNWPEYPLQSLPSNFHGEKLTILRMHSSPIKELGEGFKSHENLTTMDFSYCKFLTKIPDLSRSPNLKELTLRHCTNLVEVHDYVGFLDKLENMNLLECSSLRCFPTRLKLRSLKLFELKGCSRLEKFPEIECKMECLIDIGLEHTGIKELPSSIKNITRLRSLYLSGCKNLVHLPTSIHQLQHLQNLWLSGCSKLVRIGQEVASIVSATEYEISTNSSISNDDCSSMVFPSLRLLELGCCVLSASSLLTRLNCSSSLRELNLSGSDIVIIPASFKRFVGLRKLWLDDCKQLQRILGLPPTIEAIYAGGCISLESFPQLLEKFRFVVCELQGLYWIRLSGCYKMLMNIGNPSLSERHLDQSNTLSIIYPGDQIPDWFSHRKEISKGNSCEMNINGPSNWNDIKGVLLCAVFEPQNPVPLEPNFSFRVRINGSIIPRGQSQAPLREERISHLMGLDHVWLLYLIVEPNILKGNSLKFEFQIYSYSMIFKSCGAHMVPFKHEEIRANPGVLHDDADLHLDIQLSKRFLDDDDNDHDGSLEKSFYPQKKSCSSSTLEIEIADLEVDHDNLKEALDLER
ncbi:hypothetical protein F2P56_013614 [Juglans regia]|uniref:TIR domain-containing protein n=2 Tax=Juglans regia TaxID=51240 RepID=A0A834CYE8_JUGRE|nr:hypothetical protein F2P56_013614 [Juglans regia]